MYFGPKNEAEREIFAVEGFRADIQHQIQRLMNVRGVNQKQLAGLLGLTESRVSQIFSDKSNLTIRLLARIFFALDDECSITSKKLTELDTLQRMTKRAVGTNMRIYDASGSSHDKLRIAVTLDYERERPDQECSDRSGASAA